MALVQGIIDTAPLPRVTDLVRSTTAPSALINPYVGAGALAAFTGGQPAYGLQWEVFDSPPSTGVSHRSINIFQAEWLAMSVRYLLADSSDVNAELLLTRAAGGVLLFSHAQPYVVDYSILDGWQVAFHWLVAP